MAAFNGATFGAAKGYADEEIQKKIDIVSVGFVTNGSSFPTTRIDGSPLQKGDYVVPTSDSTFPFPIDGKVFQNSTYRGIFLGGTSWETRGQGMQNTAETAVANPTNESYSGTKTLQSEINIENKAEFGKREEKSNKLMNFDDLEEGDVDSYPNADAVNKLNKKNIPSSRKVAGKTLENDITPQDIVNAFKELARTYKNVTIDCDDNTLVNILTSCFKSDQILSHIPDEMTAEEYRLATAKAIYDFVTAKVQGVIKIKGSKATKSDIDAIANPEVGDEWFCQADSHFWLYTELDGWIDAGGAVDLSNYIKKTDIVDNLTTNDSQKPLSAAQGKKLKELTDTKQDKIEITDYSANLATLNPTHLFSNRKLTTMLGNIVFNIEAELPTALTNITSALKEVAKIPVLTSAYSYPSSMRIDVTRPSGYWTCEENRHEFYDNDGEHYVSPDIASGKIFYCKTCSPVFGAHDDSGNEIFIVEHLKNAQNYYLMNADGSPVVTTEVAQYTVDGTENPELFVLLYTPGQGYTFVDHYVDGDGNRVDGAFYKLQKVTLIVDKTYMYKCYLMNKMLELVGHNFIVDEQGRICTFEIVPNEQKTALSINESTITSCFNGLSGTITITPINHSASFDQMNVRFVPHTIVDSETGEEIIDYYSLMTHGSNCLSNYIIQKSL